MEIPINAQVECIDGVCGRIECMLVNPVVDKVAYLVVKEVEIESPLSEYIVPIGLVKVANTDTIKLCCTKAELVEMDPLLQVEIRMTYLEVYTGAPLAVVRRKLAGRQ